MAKLTSEKGKIIIECVCGSKHILTKADNNEITLNSEEVQIDNKEINDKNKTETKRESVWDGWFD